MVRKSRRYGVGEVRLIGGSLRGRKLQFPSVDGLRPSGDRMRETLFNWLQPYLNGARCLDLFAGSGALGIESISRGAASVTLIEQSEAVCNALKANIERLHCNTATVEKADALKWLEQGDVSFDVVFVDPPFASALVEETLRVLADSHRLSGGALVYVETSSKQKPDWPADWLVLKEKPGGQVCYRLLQVPQ